MAQPFILGENRDTKHISSKGALSPRIILDHATLTQVARNLLHQHSASTV